MTAEEQTVYRRGAEAVGPLTLAPVVEVDDAWPANSDRGIVGFRATCSRCSMTPIFSASRTDARLAAIGHWGQLHSDHPGSRVPS